MVDYHVNRRDNMEETIKLPQGEVVLRKPKAGQRNKALAIAETPQGIKNTVLMVELLPYCIKSHPFGTVPIRQALDSLECDEYDSLVLALEKLMTVGKNVEKKSVKPSE